MTPTSRLAGAPWPWESATPRLHFWETKRWCLHHVGREPGVSACLGAALWVKEGHSALL